MKAFRLMALALCASLFTTACWEDIFGPDDPYTPTEKTYTISVKPGGPVEFPAEGGSIEFKVTTNAKHTGCSYPKRDWLSMSYNKSSNTYVATVQANDTGEVRDFEFNFYAYNSDSSEKEATKTVKASQASAEAAKVSVTANPSSVDFPAEGGTENVVVTWSDGVNNLSYARSDAVSGWVKCEWKNSGGKKLLVISADANETGQSRSGDVYVYAGLTSDDISNAKAGNMDPTRAARTKVTVSQPAAQTTSVWVHANPNTLEFPAEGGSLDTDITASSGVKKLYSQRQDSVKDWIQANWNDAQLHVTAKANDTGQERSGVVKVFAALSQEDMDAALAGNINPYRAAVVEIKVTQPAGSGEAAEGALGGNFTVSSGGSKVAFSKGNLQYQASSNTWRFAEKQWNYIGNDNSKIGKSYSGWIDLFGWGTSGYNCGNYYYQPYDYTLKADYYYSGGMQYGPKGYTSLTGSNAKSDWGVYNAISNGGKQAGLWRTMTHNELDYLIFKRSTTSGIRFAKAVVNNINGLILFPDNWSKSTYSINKANEESANYSSNSISSSNWTKLENAGCVFLPAAGVRYAADYETTVNLMTAVGTSGEYWTASGDATEADADHLLFYEEGLQFRSWPRYEGRSVRLVRDM